MYLIDTNIISEVRNGKRCDTHGAAWYRQVRDDDLFLSVVVIGEIRQAIERLTTYNPRHAQTLERWLEELLRSFGERVLPVEGEGDPLTLSCTSFPFKSLLALSTPLPRPPSNCQ
jgi:predicted nucleic acid-binding protein